ncbi:MAG TPA: leucyl/phenylalanyl-tRNA--protein transferase [Thermoanaerobaculia bacterium]|nr:leucyl/phenylalanyl-tRNA--protein transferase [Thermoanaerobaculia bacterium]
MSTFPDPRYAPSDVVAMGEDLRVETLREAYRKGIFPWPHDGLPLPWFSPRRRAVLFFDELHVGRSLRKVQARSTLTFTFDRDFRSVIAACATADRPEQDGTWIEPAIVRAFTRLHERGDAHSVEAWEGDTLVGGLYGVDSGGVFTGESMFHLRPHASKLAVLFLIDHLRTRGATLLDCQVMSPHMESLGAREIPRARFLDHLAEMQASASSSLFP